MERAPWFVAGPAMGLVIVGLLWVANRPRGALGGYVDAFTSIHPAHAATA